jgi:hypothetical protein
LYDYFFVRSEGRLSFSLNTIEYLAVAITFFPPLIELSDHFGRWCPCGTFKLNTLSDCIDQGIFALKSRLVLLVFLASPYPFRRRAKLDVFSLEFSLDSGGLISARVRLLEQTRQQPFIDSILQHLFWLVVIVHLRRQ